MASYNHYQPIGSTIWTVNHNLNSRFLAMDALKLSGDGVYEKIMPMRVEVIDNNTLSVTFQTAVIGRARIVAGSIPT